MKHYFKKMTAILISALILLMLAVPAGAYNYDDREKFSGAKAAVGIIESGNSYSVTLKAHHDEVMYKLTSGGSGTLKVEFTAQMSTFHIYVYDGNGKPIDPSGEKVTAGSDYLSDWRSIDWDGSKSTGYVNYSVSKGTYYVRFIRDYTDGSGLMKFRPTFPAGSTVTATTAASGSDMFEIYLDKGDKLQLGAFINKKSVSSASYGSSNSKVVSVTSKGRIKALKAGTAVITAKSGGKTVQVRVIVEN